jgi:hypothetical protein
MGRQLNFILVTRKSLEPGHWPTIDRALLALAGSLGDPRDILRLNYKSGEMAKFSWERQTDISDTIGLNEILFVYLRKRTRGKELTSVISFKRGNGLWATTISADYAYAEQLGKEFYMDLSKKMLGESADAAVVIGDEIEADLDFETVCETVDEIISRQNPARVIIAGSGCFSFYERWQPIGYAGVRDAPYMTFAPRRVWGWAISHRVRANKYNAGIPRGIQRYGREICGKLRGVRGRCL